MGETFKPAAFTIKSNNGLLRELITPIGVSLHIGGRIMGDDPRVHQTTALWDTGATNSVITPSIVNALGLKPTGMREAHHAGGTSLVNTYLINIYLPNRLTVSGIKVTECADSVGNFGLIIGMDIISLGDFAFTNVNGKSIFSFRLPSSKAIDYVKEQDDADLYKARSIEQNQLCLCGSGKKFKDCHGKGQI